MQKELPGSDRYLKGREGNGDSNREERRMMAEQMADA